MNSILTFVKKQIAGKQKALIAGAIVAIGTFLAKHGYSDYVSYVEAIVAGVAAHVAVYFTPNK